MSELDLGQSEVINVKYNGHQYGVRYPNVKEAMAYKKTIDSKAGDEVEVFLDLLEKLGLPKSVAENFSIDQLGKLADALMASKKN